MKGNNEYRSSSAAKLLPLLLVLTFNRESSADAVESNLPPDLLLLLPSTSSDMEQGRCEIWPQDLQVKPHQMIRLASLTEQ